ncbi:MAG: transposase [Candidatus Tantalella remota]|nr:transposase [Candidatus Tantalella remota]
MALVIVKGKRDRRNFEGATYHITCRCNNQEHLFKDQRHFEEYLNVVRKSKELYDFKLHNYIVMNNHVHLLIRLGEDANISLIMHSINRRYAQWYNCIYERKGHFWENRFFGDLIETDLRLLTVSIYSDMNPVRAGMCDSPTEWEYSGAGYYIEGEENDLIDPPDIYLNLGNDMKSRRDIYGGISCAYYDCLKK